MVARFPSNARLNVGVVGATGLVGSMMRELLVEREFPVASLRLFASSRSAGTPISWKGTTIEVEDASTANFIGLDASSSQLALRPPRRSHPRWLHKVLS
jgi:aspartate-semialdehyde dehydrogenase